jgi:hypothetical protein
LGEALGRSGIKFHILIRWNQWLVIVCQQLVVESIAAVLQLHQDLFSKY